MGRSLSARLLTVFALVTGLAPLGVAQRQSLVLLVEPSFTEQRAIPPDAQVTPYLVSLSNSGRDAQGTLSVEADDYRMSYPIDLPNGTMKKLTVYLPGTAGGDAVLRLATNQGYVEQKLSQSSSYGNESLGSILLVGDHVGLMTFLRLKKPSSQTRNGPDSQQIRYPEDCYTRPGFLPDRAIAYSGVRAVVLGAGSERMTDTEVRALKTWVTVGGTLVFIGGASSPVLFDSRWTDFLPVENPRATNLPSPACIGTIAGLAHPAGKVSAMVGKLVTGSTARLENGAPIIAFRPVGIGKVVFVAVNPFEAPYETWQGRAEFFTRITGSSCGSDIYQLVSANEQFNQSSGSSYTSGIPGLVRNDANDPFSVELPPASKVGWILVLYLVLVVPLNLLLLRKIKKAEWAWVTTPLISLAFAGIFFQFAGNLYSASLSVANKGVLVLDSHFDTGYFFGSSQVFFPRGGRYDLGMKSVESIDGVGDDYRYGPKTGSSTLQSMNAFDDGTVHVDSMAVNNLSFHEFSYAQTIPTPKWLSSQLKFATKSDTGVVVDGTITNNSPYKLTGILHAGEFEVNLPDIQAGQSIALRSLRMKVSTANPIPTVSLPRRGSYSSPPRMYGPQDARVSVFDPKLASPPRVIIDGKIEGFRPGPQIGKDVDKYREVRLIAVLSDSIAPEAK